MSSIDRPAAYIEQPAETVAETRPASIAWAETALTVLCFAAAVLFASFLAVATGLI